MKSKILFLFFLILPAITSCNAHHKFLGIKNPPTDFFVKVYKELEITRCPKAHPKDINKCEKKFLISTGSGLIVKISPNHRVILSSGHVCTTDGIVAEDADFKYHWIETVRVLDRNKIMHDGHVILSKPATKVSADLCTIYSPTLEYFKTKSNIKISRKKPRIGEEIYYIGAPRGIYHPPTALIVKGIFNGNIDNLTSLVTIPAAPGSSGSVILSMNNEVYGVLFAVHPDFPVATIITSHEETKKFLEETRELLK